MAARADRKENQTAQGSRKALEEMVKVTRKVGLASVDKKRRHELRARVDTLFDGLDMEVVSLAHKTRVLMDSDEFQVMRALMNADHDVHSVASEDQQFAKWLISFEENGVPWMNRTLAAFDQQHKKTLEQEKERWLEEKALAEREEKRETSSLSVVDEAKLPGANFGGLEALKAG